MAAADLVDNDTLEAMRDLWATERDRLPTLVTVAPRAAPAKSKADDPLPLPYATMASEFHASERAYGHTIDRRKATVSIFGRKDDVCAALGAALEIFNAKLGFPGWQHTLIYPSGAKFVGWYPTNEGGLISTGLTRNGEDVWEGRIEARIASVRTVPA